jgi:xanthine dehydrogenase accessory factor
VNAIVLIRGGGDLASGVAVRLHRAGVAVLVTEIPQPLAVRRLVSVAEAVFAGSVEVEGVRARLISDADAARQILDAHEIPVLVDAEAVCLGRLQPPVVVDGRMRKRPPEFGRDIAELVIGLGPGFTAGVNCHAFVETNRGHHMGRVFWEGSAQADTAVPEPVAGIDVDRVLRAPRHGMIQSLAKLADVVREGDPLFQVDGEVVRAPFAGAVRGLLHDGLTVEPGMKVGDLDPRAIPRFCREISDKSLAVGGGVLEAILSRSDLRRRLLR